MKRDLKKWLNSKTIEEFLKLTNVKEWDDLEICEKLIDKSDTVSTYESIPPSEVIEFIWMEAQKAFLKEMLDDIDKNIDKLFRGKDQVVGHRAKHVAYEADLKKYIHNKYLYLKRKNGK